MIEYHDIKEVLSKTSPKKLTDEYTARQIAALRQQETEAHKVLNEINHPFMKLLNYYPDSMTTFITFLILLRSENDELTSEIVSILEKHGFTSSCDLLVAMQLADAYFEKTISLLELKIRLKSLLTYEKILKTNDSNLQFIINEDLVSLTPADRTFSFEHLEKGQRKHMCHHLASKALLKHPTLEGAYYYIPTYFGSCLEHSVLIDEYNHQVYDLANNIAIPKENWQKQYPNPTFTISGREFQELSTQTQKDFGYPISLQTIEQVRRRLK